MGSIGIDIGTVPARAAFTRPISGGGGDGGPATSTNSGSYVLDSNTTITLATTVDHLGTRHYDDGTYGHKFSINSQGAAREESSNEKNTQISNHAIILNATDVSNPPTFYVPNDSPELAAYPDSSLFGGTDADKVFTDAIKVTATALKESVGTVLDAATIVSGLINAIDGFDNRSDFAQFDWAYTFKKSDVAHQAKLFVSHSDTKAPYFDMKTQVANSAFNRFFISLGADAGVIEQSTASASTTGPSANSTTPEYANKTPLGDPEDMTEEERKKYGVRKIQNSEETIKPGTASVKSTYIVEKFPIDATDSQVDLTKKQKRKRERKALADIKRRTNHGKGLGHEKGKGRGHDKKKGRGHRKHESN